MKRHSNTDRIKSKDAIASMSPEFTLSPVPKLKVWADSEIDAAISERTLFFVKITKHKKFWFRIVDRQPSLRTVSVMKVPDIRFPGDAGSEPAQVSKDSIICVIDQWPGYLKTKRFN